MPKISELNALSHVNPGDLVPVVHDPGGLPSTNQITVNNLAASLFSNVSTAIIPSSNNNVNLGNYNNYWGNMYLGNTIYIGTNTISTAANGALLIGGAPISSGGGSSGFTGSAGTNGTNGYAGSEGYTGSSGQSGASGYTGSAGASGVPNFTGTWVPISSYNQFDIVTYHGSSYYWKNLTPGNSGGDPSTDTTDWGIVASVGYTGSVGASITGYTGSVGSGYTGSAGTNGTNGFVGSQGTQGAVGYTGSAGAGGGGSGFTGSVGNTGYVGSHGNTGFTGSAGTGYTGSAGLDGAGSGPSSNLVNGSYSLNLNNDGSLTLPTSGSGDTKILSVGNDFITLQSNTGAELYYYNSKLDTGDYGPGENLYSDLYVTPAGMQLDLGGTDSSNNSFMRSWAWDFNGTMTFPTVDLSASPAISTIKTDEVFYIQANSFVWELDGDTGDMTLPGNINAVNAHVVTLNTGDQVTFSNFSGEIIVNDLYNGYVYKYLVGSGTLWLLGTTNSHWTPSNSPPSNTSVISSWVRMDYPSTTSRYTFTNLASSRDYNFFTIKTRNIP